MKIWIYIFITTEKLNFAKMSVTTLLHSHDEMHSHDGVYLHSNATWLCSESTEPELCEFIILFKYLLLIGF